MFKHLLVFWVIFFWVYFLCGNYRIPLKFNAIPFTSRQSLPYTHALANKDKTKQLIKPKKCLNQKFVPPIVVAIIPAASQQNNLIQCEPISDTKLVIARRQFVYWTPKYMYPPKGRWAFKFSLKQVCVESTFIIYGCWLCWNARGCAR